MLNENILIGEIAGRDSRTEQARPRVDGRPEPARQHNGRPVNGAAEFAEKMRKAIEADKANRAKSRRDVFEAGIGAEVNKPNRKSAAKASSSNVIGAEARAAADRNKRVDTRKPVSDNSKAHESGDIHAVAGAACDRSPTDTGDNGRTSVAGTGSVSLPVDAGDAVLVSVAGADNVHDVHSPVNTGDNNTIPVAKANHDRSHNHAVAATTSENRAAFQFSAAKKASEHNVFSLTNSVALEVRNNQASELIEQALANLAGKLKLPSEFTPDTQSLIKFDRESFGQLADILWTLERIGSLLDKAAIGTESLKLPEMEISVGDAAALSADVRVEKFHIQMGLSLIGAREIVSDIIAEKSGQYQASGISQATAPADLGMSAIDTVRVFGGMMEESAAEEGMIEENLTAAIKRISSAKDELAANAQAAEVKTAGAKQQAAPELAAADSQTMREMFKASARDNHNVNHSRSHNDNRANEMPSFRISSANTENVKAGVVSDDIEIPVSISELTNDKAHKGKPEISNALINAINEEAAKAKAKAEGVNVTTSAFADRVTISVNGEIAMPAPKAEHRHEHAKAGASHQSIDKNTVSMSGAIAQSMENAAGDNGAQSDADQPAANQIDAVQAKANAATEGIQKAADAFSRVDQEAVIRQIIEKMQNVVRTGAGTHEVRMILRPEALGEVRMSIRVEGDVVFARMQVENSQVKAIVESQMQSLKDSLSEQNLHAAAVSVDVRSDSDGSLSDRQEMAELARVHKFRQDNGGGANGGQDNGFASVAAGADTGRRFGNHTFEYFI